MHLTWCSRICAPKLCFLQLSHVTPKQAVDLCCCCTKRRRCLHQPSQAFFRYNTLNKLQYFIVSNARSLPLSVQNEIPKVGHFIKINYEHSKLNIAICSRLPPHMGLKCQCYNYNLYHAKTTDCLLFLVPWNKRMFRCAGSLDLQQYFVKRFWVHCVCN